MPPPWVYFFHPDFMILSFIMSKVLALIFMLLALSASLSFV
jgi:hypothetical protein